MADLLAAIPWPVWVLAPALVAIGWLWAAAADAPANAPESDEDDGSVDEAEPPLVPGWGEERW